MIGNMLCGIITNVVFTLFKLLFEILKLSHHWVEMLKERIYEQTFILSVGARKEDTSARRAWEKLRGKNAKYFAYWYEFYYIKSMHKCVHILLTDNKQMKNQKKLFLLYFTCHPRCLYLCICPSNFIQYLLVKLYIHVYHLNITI